MGLGQQGYSQNADILVALVLLFFSNKKKMFENDACKAKKLKTLYVLNFSEGT